MDQYSKATAGRIAMSGLLLYASLGVAAPPEVDAPVQVSVRLTEWKVALSRQTIEAGTVRFAVTNAGSIPHGFEVEGGGIEKEIETIQPGASDTLTLTLKSGTYEVYCPVGDDSHKKLGMETHLKVVGGDGSESSGYGASEMSESHAMSAANCWSVQPALSNRGRPSVGFSSPAMRLKPICGSKLLRMLRCPFCTAAIRCSRSCLSGRPHSNLSVSLRR
jgi:plastocyanin